MKPEIKTGDEIKDELLTLHSSILMPIKPTTQPIKKFLSETEKTYNELKNKKWVALDDVDYYYIRKSELAEILKEKIPDDVLLWDLYETIGIWEKIVEDLDKK